MEDTNSNNQRDLALKALLENDGKPFEPMIPDRSLLFVSDYWDKERFWEKYYIKPAMIWMPDIS